MKIKHLIIISFICLFAVQTVAAKKQVKLLTLEWEPYAGSGLSQKGFTSAIIIKAFEKAGYDVVIEFHPWDEAMVMARNGEVDGVFPAYHANNHEVHFLFSKPITQSPLELCKIRHFQSPSPGGGDVGQGYYIQYNTDPRINQTQALRDLKKYTFGVVKGYSNTPEFDAADFLTKVQAMNDEENVAQLLRNDVQLIAIDRYVAKNIMIKKFPWRAGEIEFMRPALSMKALYLLISKNVDHAEEKMKAFESGLAILKEDKVVDRLKRTYGL